MKSGTQKLKKFLAFVMTAVMVLTAVPLGGLTFSASAENEEYYTYRFKNGEASITSCAESISGDVVIPDTLGGYPVTSIGDHAFSWCTSLTSITIPDSVTRIGAYAFFDCTGLTSITIPGRVTSIGDKAFFDCTGLTNITIPDGVINIGYATFYGCKSLTSVTIGNSVTSIGDRAFYGCTGLIRINWNAESVNDFSCNNYIFSNAGTAGKGVEVVFGDSAKSIPDYLFNGSCAHYETPKIKSVTIRNSVTSIGNSAFANCTGLTSITIPGSVTSIGDHAFYRCNGLTSVTIPDSVTSIGNSAFANCTALTSITIPDGITSIGYGAFYGCTGLTSITIPNSVTSIGEVAFEGCGGLTSIIVSPGNTVYHSTDNCLIETESKTLILGCNNSVIPSDGSVTSIGDQAFYNCNGLTSVTIPDSVTSIGLGAFEDCTGLTSITIPDSVTSIGAQVFFDCTGLTSVTIPDSVTSIGDYAFYKCSGLTSITIPDSVTSIGDKAFYGCRRLTSINIPQTITITDIGDRAFGYYYYYGTTRRIENFKIYGYSNTAAETYANENGFAFIALDEEHTHTYSAWAVTTEATCTAEGVETRTCSVCGATETRPVERKTHTFGEWVTTKEATVFESGERKRTCTGCGKVSETNPINKVSSIKLSKTSFTYNGKVQKPTVTVKDSKGTALKNGTDYTVTSSSGCKNIGKYCVEVTFKGNYSGSKKLSFSILPQGTSIESLSASSAGFTAKWKKKTNQITGYQLQYSTSNSFKSVKTITIKKNSDTSRSVSNLKGRTKYYVRVRTYKKVGNKNYYSSWSSAKTVATKPVTGVEILSSATIYVGGSKTLSAKTYPTKVPVKWKSSNTSVAKVSSNGKVTAIKKGKATITAYFTYDGKTYKANCAVTVKSRNPK